jgi:hypothetical protein
MFELITTLLTTEEALSVTERQANSLSLLSVAPVEPLLKRSGTGSDEAGLFGGLASELFISSPIHASGVKMLYDNSVTAFSAPAKLSGNRSSSREELQRSLREHLSDTDIRR